MSKTKLAKRLALEGDASPKFIRISKTLLSAYQPATIVEEDVDSNNNKITTPTKDESHYRFSTLLMIEAKSRILKRVKMIIT